MRPLISVILPAYNAESYVGQAIESILDQTFTDFELIILNDKSTDNTLSIIQKFSDVRIVLINNETNLKVVKTLNKGLELARGEFIARMDADDISHSRRFEKQLKYFRENPNIDLCGTWIQHFGKEESVLKAPENHEYIKASLFFLNPIFHPSIMFKKDSFKKFNLQYDEKFVNAEDYGLWVNAIDKLKFANVPEVMLKYRIHGTNVSVMSDWNKGVLDKIHYHLYEVFLNKLKIGYNRESLVMHRNLALTNINKLEGKELDNYLLWIEKLIEGNKRTNYFDCTAFRNTVISYFLLIIKRAKHTPVSLIRIGKTAFNSYSLVDYLHFFYYKLRTKNKQAQKF